MGVNSLPKTVTRQRRGCDLNPGPSPPESSTLTTRLPSHTLLYYYCYKSQWQAGRGMPRMDTDRLTDERKQARTNRRTDNRKT